LDKQSGEQKIVVPKSLQQQLTLWYHTQLIHPGVERLYNTLKQHYVWPRMKETIAITLRSCDACQKAKRGGRGMGLIPLKDTEKGPWRDVAVDLAGPWKARINSKNVKFHALTIIDPFTCWVEVIPIKGKTGEYMRDLIEQQWLRRYPRPERIIFDQGGEFDNQWMRALAKKWICKCEPITVKNPQANAIVERLHRVMGDMIRSQIATRYKFADPISEMLSAAAYGIRATVHGTTRFTPGQLVFRRDMILRTEMEANMELVRQRRATAIAKGNLRENKRRIKYDYKQGDQVLILAGGLDPKLKLHEGPFKVLSYNKSSGTLHIKRRNYIEPINVRRVRPYFGSNRGGD